MVKISQITCKTVMESSAEEIQQLLKNPKDWNKPVDIDELPKHPVYSDTDSESGRFIYLHTVAQTAAVSVSENEISPARVYARCKEHLENGCGVLAVDDALVLTELVNRANAGALEDFTQRVKRGCRRCFVGGVE